MAEKGVLRRICDDHGIRIRLLTDQAAEALQVSPEERPGNGYAVRVGTDRFIFADLGDSVTANSFLVAHELGHHLLGHLGSGLNVETQEREADIFAAVFTAMYLFREYAPA